MKIIYTLAAMLFATLGAPALADEAWDMTSGNAAPPPPSFAQQMAAVQTTAADGSMQWDSRAINANTAAAEQAYLEQVAYEQAHRHHGKRIVSLPTGNQRNPNLPVCQAALMTPGGLPATTLDSFVMNAGGAAEVIYGDEGTSDIPPLFGFTEGNTINA